MAQTPFAIAIHHDIRNPLAHRILKLVAQHSIVNRSLLEFFACEFRRFTERNDTGNVFSACTSLALLMSADILAMKSHAASNVKRADAFRRISLCPDIVSRSQPSSSTFKRNRPAACTASV